MVDEGAKLVSASPSSASPPTTPARVLRCLWLCLNPLFSVVTMSSLMSVLELVMAISISL